MLTEQQQEIYDLVMQGKYSTILLKGQAGSGKSYIVSQIAKDYKGSVLLTATTNKAKNLLKASTGLPTMTTHSALGFRMVRNGTEEYLSDVSLPVEADLLIVDEVSMLPFQVYKKILSWEYKQVLFVGDECQLPAVGLKAEIECEKVIHLTKQLRQANNPELEEWLNKFRTYISSKRLLGLKDTLPNGVCLYENHKDFCKAYLASENQKRILAYSNKVIDTYNKNINNKVVFKEGDLLVLDKPIGEAKNGDIVEVESVEDMGEFYEVTIFGDNLPLTIMKAFKTIAAQRKHLDRALAISSEKYWEEKDQIFKPKHLYASTIHKAQGQSIDEVFIDVTDIYAQLKRKPSRWNNYNKPISVEEYMKLLYVAISRMRYKAHLFVGEKRDYKGLRNAKK